MKEQIYEQIKQCTADHAYEKASAQMIADALHVSRNVVSQYLNEFFKEGRCIKINTRPVLFLDRFLIEEQNQITLSDTLYGSEAELEAAINKQQHLDFEELIGYDDSLQSVIDTCKATISYPPNGLPFLLYGPTGTGKSLIAQKTYEYALHQGLITQEQPFLILNCSEYANNPELLSANLFGHKKGAFTGADKDNPGLLKLAQGGILFLDEVHDLKAECQEKLFLFMDKGIYHMVGDHEHWYESNARLIFATTKDPKKCLLKTLLRRIPMIITVPSLQERGMRERIQLILTMFQAESKRLHKTIMMTNTVYQTLVTTDFPGNIGDLKNCIQAGCVHAYYKCPPKEPTLVVDAFDLPANLVSLKAVSDKRGALDAQNAVLTLADLSHMAGNDQRQGRLNKRILEKFAAYEEAKIGYASFLEGCFAVLDDYYDAIVLKKRYRQNAEFTYVQTLLKHALDLIADPYGIHFHNSDLIAMSAYLHDCTRGAYARNDHEQHQIHTISALHDLLQEELHREYMIAKEVANHLHANADLHLDLLALCIFTLYFKKFNRANDWNKRVGLILAHGYSTASSIADAVNRSLDQYIFDAIDMPMNVSTAAVVEQLNAHLSKMGHFEELVLLVDMGSVEEIDQGIDASRNINIAMMNHVSTKMALAVGNGIKQGRSLQEIFEEVAQAAVPTYHLIARRHKDPLILCSCASGLGTAERLQHILEDSLPKKKAIKVLTYDYNTLIEKRLTPAFFDDYEVICIVGTLNPNIDEVPFIPLEDLVINVTMDKLHDYFRNYLDMEEMRQFKSNILKNFSLSNLITTLTILNPGILLEHVATALDHLQEEMGVVLSNATCVGLYVHICCLIERLVTHAGIDTYPYLEAFVAQHQDFIAVVKRCFSVVERYYSVEITPSEIAYIYEYIEHNEEKS